MLEALITSKTRLKLLIKFFVSASNSGYLRGLAEEFDESTNSIRKELNQLTEAGFLLREQDQNKVNYKANIRHPLFAPVQKLIHSFLGIEQAIDQVMARAGDVEQVILRGDYARGIEAECMQVSIVGDHLDTAYLLQVAGKTSELIGKRVEMSFDKPHHEPCIIIYQKEGKGKSTRVFNRLILEGV